MGMGGYNDAPAALQPGKTSGTHFIGGWEDSRAVQEVCGKSRPPVGFDPRIVQPIASRYTDYAIPAPASFIILSNSSFNKHPMAVGGSRKTNRK